MEHIVGKPKFKTAIIYITVTIAWSLFLFAFGSSFGLEVKSVLSPMQIFSIFLIVISLLIVLPGISYCQLMWKVDDQMIRYTYHGTMIDKIISFYRHIFKTKRLIYQISIYLDQIDYIRVTYVKQLRGPFSLYGYDVLFKIHTLDGSIFTFDALVTTDRESFNNAVSFIKSKGIYFEDQYHILDELQHSRPISYYLDKLEKEKRK